MIYPQRYITLLDFLIDFRLNKTDDFDCDINFKINLLKNTDPLLTRSEILTEMLKKIRVAVVYLKDVANEKEAIRETTVLKSFKIQNNIVIIKGCTTIKLKFFKKKIQEEQKTTALILNGNNKTIKYKDSPDIKFFKAAPFKALQIIHGEYPFVASYNKLKFELTGDRRVNNELKTVQNIVNQIYKRTKDVPVIPKDFIRAVPGEGYILTI